MSSAVERFSRKNSTRFGDGDGKGASHTLPAPVKIYVGRGICCVSGSVTDIHYISLLSVIMILLNIVMNICCWWTYIFVFIQKLLSKQRKKFVGGSISLCRTWRLVPPNGRMVPVPCIDLGVFNLPNRIVCCFKWNQYVSLGTVRLPGSLLSAQITNIGCVNLQ